MHFYCFLLLTSFGAGFPDFDGLIEVYVYIGNEVLHELDDLLLILLRVDVVNARVYCEHLNTLQPADPLLMPLVNLL